MLEVLKSRVEPSEFLWVRGLSLAALEPERVLLEVSGDYVVKILREKHVEEKLWSFFREEIYKDTHFDLQYQVALPTEIPVDDSIPAISLESGSLPESSSQSAHRQDERRRWAEDLNEAFIFDTFVMGGSNRFAYESAKVVASYPGERGNPFFIYGEVGLGKTHLLHAIAHEILNKFPGKVVRYVSCETLMNEFVEAIRNRKSLPEFRRIREVDCLLVDDIQFLSNKEAFQEEFYHAFNELWNVRKQIVLAADRTPQQISGLQDRLLSRFKGGLIADIKLPDLETRMAIIKNLAIQEKVVLSNENIEYLASSVSSNVRELRGAFVRIAAMSSFENRPIDRGLIETVLCSIMNSRPRLSLEVIQEEVARVYHVEISDLLSESRNKEIAYPRQVAMFLIRELTNMTLQQIGASFHRKDHGTVIHAMNKIQKVIQTRDSEARKIEELKDRLEKSFER